MQVATDERPKATIEQAHECRRVGLLISLARFLQDASEVESGPNTERKYDATKRERGEGVLKCFEESEVLAIVTG